MVRLKSRYLLFEVLYPDSYNPKNPSSLANPRARVDYNRLVAAVRGSILDNFGDLGTGLTQATLNLKYFSPATSMGIIRVAREHVRTVQAALTYLGSIDNTTVIIRVLRVSGTIKHSEKHAIGRNSKFVAQLAQ